MNTSALSLLSILNISMTSEYQKYQYAVTSVMKIADTT